MKYKILMFILLLFSLNLYCQETVTTDVSNGNNSKGNIISVDPNSATIPELLTVQISGSDTHFAMGTGTEVWFTQASSTIYPVQTTAISNTLISSEIAFKYYYSPGYYDVNTINQYDGHLILENGFYLYPNPNPPYLVSINPTGGIAGEIITITVTGQNTHFSQVDNSATLWNSSWFFIYGSLYNVLSDNVVEVQFLLPSDAPSGVYNFKIFNQFDGPLSLNYIFTIYPDPNPPYLTSVSPNSGNIPETLTVSISGQNTNFAQGTGTIVRFEQGSSTIYPNWVNAVSNNVVQAEFSFDNYDNTGYYDVKTINALDGELMLDNGFYLYPDPYPPHLVSIEPDAGQTGESLSVEISGQYTHFSQGTGTVLWLNQGSYSIYPSNTSITSGETINADFYFYQYAPTGFYDVNTQNVPDGHLVLEDAFELKDSITGVQTSKIFQTVSVSPNPNNGRFIVSLQLAQQSDITMVLCDLPGNRLYEKKRKNIQSLKEKVNTNSLSTGIYILKIYAGNDVFIKKIIITR